MTWYGAGANDSYAVAVGDVNNDGFADIAYQTSGTRRGMATRESPCTSTMGNGTFHLGSRLATDGYGATFQSIAIDDVNGDSKGDLVVLNSGDFLGRDPIHPP